MSKRFTLILSALLLVAGNLPADPGPGTDVPVAPIASTNFMGWTNAYVLQNAAVDVVVVPAAGRIAQIRCRGGADLLRLDTDLGGRVPGADAHEPWLNFGGDWLWPVAQSRWKSMAESDWPPPPALADLPWAGTAWKDADGTLCCLIEREYGAPVNAKVSRLIKLDREAPRLSVRQRIERTAESDLPLVLWNITQVSKAELVVLPADAESALEKGFKALLFGLPGGTQVTACADALVYDAASGEHKLCSDSKRGWIAARKGGTVLIERATEGPAGQHPDGGCTVEMYSNAGLGYSEIETLSAEMKLLPGESLQNTLILQCVPVTNAMTACGLAEFVRGVLGE